MVNEDKKKESRRAPVSLRVEYFLDGNSHNARALNLSSTGMLIETQTPAPLAERLQVAFNIPGSEEVVQTDAEVVWVNKYSPNYPNGMAIKFLGLQKPARAAIEDYVRKVLESPRAYHKDAIVAIPD
jgi:uncharacterized protein (TIGR02266 family)